MLAIYLKPGDVITGPGNTEVTILRDREPWQDMFGQQLFRYWARRSDTHAEGWMTYGPAGVVSIVKRGVGC